MRAHQLDDNGEILNTIEVESLDIFPNLIDASIGGSIGDRIIDGVLIPKEQSQNVTAVTRHITKLAFRNRFTQAEKVALELASLDNPAGTPEERQKAAALRVNLADLSAASYIDLARPDTRTAVQMLESAGLLAAGRALEILDTPIDELEKTPS